jgi:glutathione S-transferase
MTPDNLKLYHSPSSPNSRRVRIFLAEKRLTVALVAIDLGKGEQHSEAYRAINQIPALVERSVLRVKDFFADLNERLGQVPFVAGERYSAADITALVTVDFAKALELSVPEDQAALKRWSATVSIRPSAAA